MICSQRYVRLLSGLDKGDVDDTDLRGLVDYAWEQVMGDTGIRIVEEEIEKIDDYRQNNINGNNTTFYVQKSYTRYIGDSNGDQEVTVDDLTVYEYDSSDTRSELTLSSVESNGKFVTASAPASGSDGTVTYLSVPLPITHHLYKRACAQLSASMAFTRLDAGDYEKVGFRGISITKNTEGFNKFYNRYKETINTINSYSGTVSKSVAPERKYEMELSPAGRNVP